MKIFTPCGNFLPQDKREGRVTTIPLLRRNNIRNVVGQIWRGGSVTRGELAERTSLTAPTISTIIGTLLRNGIIKKSGKADSSGGRQPDVLTFNPAAYYALGLSLGVYRLKAAITDLFGVPAVVLDEPVLYSPDRKIFSKQITDIARRAVKSFSGKRKIVGAGISVPGTVDNATGRILTMPIIESYADFDVRSPIEDAIGLPVFLDNNANLCALHEAFFGAGKGKRYVLFFFAGYGIGMGLVINGDIYSGAKDASGEVGHTVIEMNGERCYCGGRGCLETVASYPALFKEYKRKIKKGTTAVRSHPGNEKFSIERVEKIFIRAGNGDKTAADAVRKVGSYLGVALSNILGMFNPDIVVIGGDYLKAADIIETPIREAVKARAWPAVKDTKIVFTSFGRDADVLGAATLVIKHFLCEGLHEYIED